MVASCSKSFQLSDSPSDLASGSLANVWDEAIPLGNASIGALVWQKDSSLRLSLDRTDLWDLRDMDSLSGPNYSFNWVKERLHSGHYEEVQEKFDWPYDMEPAPAKIPGGAIEFPLDAVGSPDSVHLYLNNAVCELTWPSGMRMTTFVEANNDCGWFEIVDASEGFEPVIVPPSYAAPDGSAQTDQAGADLARLGYKQGEVITRHNGTHYTQKGYGDFSYDIDVVWQRSGNKLSGVWSITSSLSNEKAESLTSEALKRGIDKAMNDHMAYWNEFNTRGRVTVPDEVIQRQYDNDHYKLGSSARSYSYPISLQAVWTADNGHMPPWKGDYHHDLNTQLSYWPTYTGNHLDEESGYLNTLWNQRDTYRDYTRTYFGVDGLNVPGVCTLDGRPLGGWIQYSMSQSCGAWLAQHFYNHWKYSADSDFLRDRAYPFISEAAEFAENITIVKPDGTRTLEISSSPEVFDNSPEAWFGDITNYDLALIKNLFLMAAEASDSLSRSDDAERWRNNAAAMPNLAIASDGSLLLAPGKPLDFSHRHFSHAMSIYPLGTVQPTRSESEKRIADATINRLDSIGPDYWVGYSYSWLGALKARNLDGEGAANAIRTFAECFVGPNTFHLNGDQTKSGKSRFTYRPFTLEGNFASMAALQEMLLQSHTGAIVLFPAIPSDWKDVSFSRFLARGGIEVSASLSDGKIEKVTLCNVGKRTVTSPISFTYSGHIIKVTLRPGDTVTLSGNELL